MDVDVMISMQNYLINNFSLNEELLFTTVNGNYLYGKFVNVTGGFLIVKREIPGTGTGDEEFECLFSLEHITMITKNPRSE